MHHPCEICKKHLRTVALAAVFMETSRDDTIHLPLITERKQWLQVWMLNHAVALSHCYYGNEGIPNVLNGACLNNRFIQDSEKLFRI